MVVIVGRMPTDAKMETKSQTKAALAIAIAAAIIQKSEALQEEEKEKGYRIHSKPDFNF